MFFIQLGCLYSPKCELGESQNDILELNSRYTSLIILSDGQHIYPRLTVVVIYYSKQLEKQEAEYIYGKLGEKE